MNQVVLGALVSYPFSFIEPGQGVVSLSLGWTVLPQSACVPFFPVFFPHLFPTKKLRLENWVWLSQVKT